MDGFSRPRASRCANRHIRRTSRGRDIDDKMVRNGNAMQHLLELSRSVNFCTTDVSEGWPPLAAQVKVAAAVAIKNPRR